MRRYRGDYRTPEELVLRDFGGSPTAESLAFHLMSVKEGGAGMEPLAIDDPQQVGLFRLHFRLGAGGMGRVFLGFSPAGRAVAVKVVHPEYARDPEFVERFRREVRAAEAVSGAYTAPVVAAGPDDDPPWLATAFIAGPSLAELIEQAGPLPEAAVWRLAGGLVEALQAVHARHLVHRDLKPTNVLIAADGPRVIDFGISRALEGTALTASSIVVGTPAFMSPEQVQGLPAGFPSDVFALGGVITFAVTGAAPFGSGDLVATAYRIVHSEPDLNGMVSSLRDLVVRCLAKAPVDRPPLDRLLDAIKAGSAFYPDVSLANFWPEPVAGLIRSRQDSLLDQLAPGAQSRHLAVLPSIPHAPTAPAWDRSSHDNEEATRTAASLSDIRAKPLIPRPEPRAGEPISPRTRGVQPAEATAINRVPRTEMEQQQLLLVRPVGWEFLYFGARLLHELNAAEGKYRDYLVGYAPPTGEVVSRLEAAVYIENALYDTQRIVEELGHIMNDSDAYERAFGRPGEDGNPEALADYAKRMNGKYEGLIDWAPRLRGASIPSEFAKYVWLVASINDSSISAYREFVNDYVAANDLLPAQIAASEPVRHNWILRFTIPDDTINGIRAEAERHINTFKAEADRLRVIAAEVKQLGKD